MPRQLAEQIAATELSRALQDATWVVPASQSIHIASLAVLFVSAMMVNVRLLGVGRSSHSVSSAAAAFLPWMWRALAVSVFTGVLQTFIEPVRQFITPIFWWKMLLIASMALLTAWLQKAIRSNAALWDGPHRPPAARVFAVVSTLAWITVISFGRFIGYVWGNYV